MKRDVHQALFPFFPSYFSVVFLYVPSALKLHSMLFYAVYGLQRVTERQEQSFPHSCLRGLDLKQILLAAPENSSCGLKPCEAWAKPCKTIAKSSYWGYMNLECFSSPHPNMVKYRGIYIKAAKKPYSQKQSLHYAWICCCPSLRHEDMVRVPASQPGGACLLGGKVTKIFQHEQKRLFFLKKPRGNGFAEIS